VKSKKTSWRRIRSRNRILWKRKIPTCIIMAATGNIRRAMRENKTNPNNVSLKRANRPIREIKMSGAWVRYKDKAQSNSLGLRVSR
jgi:hypothetical protein